MIPNLLKFSFHTMVFINFYRPPPLHFNTVNNQLALITVKPSHFRVIDAS